LGNGKLASLGSRCPIAIKKHPVSQKNIKNVYQNCTHLKKRLSLQAKPIIKGTMIIVTGREFRASQAKYFDFANQGEDVIIKSRRGSFRIIPVTNEDVVYNDKQLTEMIDRALKQVQAGEVYEMKEEESAEQFINRMLEDSDQ
jgi:hypothetical protein